MALLSTFTAAGSTPGSGLRTALRRRPELLVLALWAICIPAVVSNPISHDVVWQLWIGRHLDAGVPLYSWIMEVNPPLWYWMGQGLTQLSALTGVPATTVAALAHWLATGLALLLSACLLAGQSLRVRVTLLAAALLITGLVFARDFAQREHLAMLAALPYALLIANRKDARKIAWPVALAVGLFAAPGFALKHYLVLVPLALEAWLLWSRRGAWRPIRPETVALGVGAVAYAVAIFWLERDYFTQMVPLLSLAYADFGSHPLRLLLSPVVLAAPLAVIYFWYARHELTTLICALLVAAAGFGGSYLAQMKGFSYHAAPVICFVLLALVAHRASRSRMPEPHNLRWLGAATAAILVVEIVASGVVYRNDDRDRVERLLADAAPGQAAILISTNPTDVWPMVEDLGLVWPSRYFHYWMLPAVYAAQESGRPLSAELADFVRQMRRETVADFRCHPPEIILEDGKLLGLFLQDPDFAELFTHYRLGEIEGRPGEFLASWHLATPYGAPGEGCQPLSARP